MQNRQWGHRYVVACWPTVVDDKSATAEGLADTAGAGAVAVVVVPNFPRFAIEEAEGVESSCR